jgi:hypothetical protein
MNQMMTILALDAYRAAQRRDPERHRLAARSVDRSEPSAPAAPRRRRLPRLVLRTARRT